MHTLVTGASGFAGTHLVRHLRECGDTVDATDVADGGPDILDPSGLADYLMHVAPEVVFHLAGWADVASSWQNPDQTFSVNAVGTHNLLQACLRAGVDRVVVVSSADVYGPLPDADEAITETRELRPTTPYAASKAAAEMSAIQAFLGHGLDTIRVRSFNHLGRDQTANFVAPALAQRIATVEAEPKHGDAAAVIPVGNLTAVRDFTNVRDVARAYRLLAQAGRAGEAYNVASGVGTEISAIAEHFIGRASCPIRLEQDPNLMRPVDTPILIGDASKLIADTGWQPQISLPETLDDVLDDFRQRQQSSPVSAPD